MPVDPQLKVMLEQSAARASAAPGQFPPQALRAGYRAAILTALSAEYEPTPLAEVGDADASGVPVRVCQPASGREPLPVVAFGTREAGSSAIWRPTSIPPRSRTAVFATPEYDVLSSEGALHAQRLRGAGSWSPTSTARAWCTASSTTLGSLAPAPPRGRHSPTRSAPPWRGHTEGTHLSHRLPGKRFAVRSSRARRSAAPGR